MKIAGMHGNYRLFPTNRVEQREMAAPLVMFDKASSQESFQKLPRGDRGQPVHAICGRAT
jgi:hypothetical protein